MPAQKKWPAPAKINLFLHVLSKRADGYHNLQTVFQLLDYGDELIFDVNDSGELTRSYYHQINETQDLCLRAAKLLKQETGCKLGVEIGLEKRLPIGGGLGGGSSNAATTLIALNHLWDLQLSRKELSELGLQLGADVPVFIYGRSAWAEGVGERLSAISLPHQWYLVLVPAISVSTAKIFANKYLTLKQEMLTIRAFREGQGENQFEPLVRAEYPPVDDLLLWLSEFGEPRMTGTGASVFLPVQNREQAMQIFAERPVDINGFVARGINLHPLLDV